MSKSEAPAATGKARLHKTEDGRLFLQINNGLYLVEEEENSFRLVKAQNGPTYNISINKGDLPKCDCPDATFRDRPNVCKHTAALRAVGLIA